MSHRAELYEITTESHREPPHLHLRGLSQANIGENPAATKRIARRTICRLFNTSHFLHISLDSAARNGRACRRRLVCAAAGAPFKISLAGSRLGSENARAGPRPFLEEAAGLALRPEASCQHERMDLCVVSPGWRFFVGRNERLPPSLIQEQELQGLPGWCKCLQHFSVLGV